MKLVPTFLVLAILALSTYGGSAQVQLPTIIRKIGNEIHSIQIAKRIERVSRYEWGEEDKMEEDRKDILNDLEEHELKVEEELNSLKEQLEQDKIDYWPKRLTR